MATWALAIIMEIGFVKAVGMLGEPKTGDLLVKEVMLNGKTVGTMIGQFAHRRSATTFVHGAEIMAAIRSFGIATRRDAEDIDAGLGRCLENSKQTGSWRMAC